MLPEIKLVIRHNDSVIETVTKNAHKQSLIKSLEEFQLAVNATLTRMIEELGDSGDCNVDEEYRSSDEDENDIQVSPKKRKKIIEKDSRHSSNI